MKKITVILIRKIFPTADSKTVIFLAAGLSAVIGALWGPGMELWEALHKWKDYDFDFWHVIDSHGPSFLLSMSSFWLTMKASDLIPDFLQDVPMTIEQSTVKISESPGKPPVITVSQETHAEPPQLPAPQPDAPKE